MKQRHPINIRLIDHVVVRAENLDCCISGHSALRPLQLQRPITQELKTTTGT